MKPFNLSLIVLFLAALILRLSLVVLAHHGDLNNNISWGIIAYEKGFDGFYEGYQDTSSELPQKEDGQPSWPYSAPNQPPLTIEMFAAARLVWQKFRDFFWYMNWTLLIFPSKLVWFWDEKGMDVMVKLPSIIADLAIGWVIYNYILKKFKSSNKLALILTAVWLFNPVTWYNSSIWGQTDSIVNVLGLVAVISLLGKRLIKFSFFFTLSLLFKGSLAIFSPIFVVVALKQKYPPKEYTKAFLCSLLVVVFVSVWFHPNWDLFAWLYQLYKDRIFPGEIGYLTANAFNFWWLVDPGRVLDNNLYFGIPARLC